MDRGPINHRCAYPPDCARHARVNLNKPRILAKFCTRTLAKPLPDGDLPQSAGNCVAYLRIGRTDGQKRHRQQQVLAEIVLQIVQYFQ